MGRPLLQGSKQELVPPCYRTLQLSADEQGCPLVTLSNLSNQNGMCIHVSVTDVIHKTIPALEGSECLCSISGPGIG